MNFKEGIKRYSENISWMLLEKITRILSGVIIGAAVARYLGPSSYGLISYAVAITAITETISKLGLDDIIVREILREEFRINQILGTSFWLKIIASALVFGGIFLFMTLLKKEYSQSDIHILILSLGLIFNSFENIEYYYQAKVRAKIISICKTIQLSISILAKIYLLTINAEVFWFIVILATDYLSIGLAYFISYSFSKEESFIRQFNTDLAKKFLSDSWPLIISSLFIFLYMRIDQLMIKEFLNTKELGIYSASVKLSEVFYFLPTVVCNGLFPAIINAKKNNQAQYFKRLQRLYQILIGLGIILAFGTQLFGEFAIQVLFGTSFIEGSSILKIHIWASPFVFFGVARSKWLVAENLQIFGTYYLVLGAIVNFILNYFLIPIYGGIGAAYSTLLSLLSVCLLFPLINRRMRKSVKMFFNSFIISKSFIHDLKNL